MKERNIPRAIVGPRTATIEHARFVARTIVEEREALKRRLAEMTAERNDWRQLFIELLETVPTRRGEP